MWTLWLFRDASFDLKDNKKVNEWKMFQIIYFQRSLQLISLKIVANDSKTVIKQMEIFSLHVSCHQSLTIIIYIAAVVKTKN